MLCGMAHCCSMPPSDGAVGDMLASTSLLPDSPCGGRVGTMAGGVDTESICPRLGVVAEGVVGALSMPRSSQRTSVIWADDISLTQILV